MTEHDFSQLPVVNEGKQPLGHFGRQHAVVLHVVDFGVGDKVAPIDLQPREFRVLEYLMRHAGQVVTRAMLLEHVWGYHFDPQTNVIDVHVSRLRQKIDRDFDNPLLVTVRGAGYRLGPVTEG